MTNTDDTLFLDTITMIVRHITLRCFAAARCILRGGNLLRRDTLTGRSVPHTTLPLVACVGLIRECPFGTSSGWKPFKLCKLRPRRGLILLTPHQR